MFSKYALICKDPKALAIKFLCYNAWTFPALSLGALLLSDLYDFDRWLVLVVVVWACSQGIKDFLGQALRRTDRYSLFSRLYIFDSLFTLFLTICVGLSVNSIEAFVAVSALSSLVLSMFFWRFPIRAASESRLSVSSIVVYSAPLVLASSATGGFLAILRRMLNVVAGPEIGGILNFLYEVVQKPLSLISSSIVTAIVPDLARRPAGIQIYSAALIYLSTFSLMLIGPLALQSFWPSPILLPSDPDVLYLVALVVFINKFKSGFVELPFMLVQRPAPVVAGSFLTVLLIYLMQFVPWAKDLENLLVGAVGVQLLAVLVTLVWPIGDRKVKRAVSVSSLGVIGAALAATSVVTNLRAENAVGYLVAFTALVSTAVILVYGSVRVKSSV